MDDLDGNIVSDSGTILTFVCILIWASVEFVFNLFKQTIIPFSINEHKWAVVVAQLAERSLPTPEVRSSENFYIE